MLVNPCARSAQQGVTPLALSIARRCDRIRIAIGRHRQRWQRSVRGYVRGGAACTRRITDPVWIRACSTRWRHDTRGGRHWRRWSARSRSGPTPTWETACRRRWRRESRLGGEDAPCIPPGCLLRGTCRGRERTCGATVQAIRPMASPRCGACGGRRRRAPGRCHAWTRRVFQAQGTQQPGPARPARERRRAN